MVDLLKPKQCKDSKEELRRKFNGGGTWGS